MKSKHFKNLALLFVGTVLFGGLLVPSSYGTVTFDTGLTTTAQHNSVDAKAAISISGNVMTVVLTDLYPNPNSVANVLNGIKINIAGVTGVSSLTANSATTADIARNGTYTPTTTAGNIIASSIGWTVSGSTTIKLSALGTGQPQFLIIGPDANFNFTDGAGNPGYTGSNSSIDGNCPHNPFILGTETFNFDFSGNSISESSIKDVTFLFGTGNDGCGSYGYVTVASVPEPATVAAGLFLLLPLGVSTIRSLRKSRAA